MQGAMHFLDATGHTTVEWDTEVPESVEVAEEGFRRALADGQMATVETPRGREQVREFDPKTTTEITFIPAMAGG